MMDRKKVVLVGSNGALANALIPKLIKQFEVTALIRSPSNFGLNSIFYREFNGDALAPEVWDEVLEGKDAVLFTYGPRSTDDPLSLVHLTRILIDKMKEKGVNRLVTFYRHGAIVENGKYVCEQEGYSGDASAHLHTKSLELLRTSGLQWTAVCMKEFKVGESEVDVLAEGWRDGPADSAGVAAFLKEEIEHPHWVEKTVFLANKA